MFHAILFFSCLLAVPQVTPEGFKYNSKAILRLVQLTNRCAACSAISEVRVLISNCRRRLSIPCQVKELRCASLLIGKEPKYVGDQWERRCKLKERYRRVAHCTFTARECFVAPMEKSRRIGRHKLKHMEKFEKCLKRVKKTYCTDSPSSSTQKVPEELTIKGPKSRWTANGPKSRWTVNGHNNNRTVNERNSKWTDNGDNGYNDRWTDNEYNNRWTDNGYYNNR
ncbi:hypothetical protein TNCT_635731 [Trichonephila clavata]|uniref:Uncharacterized protein n=1 Tax=Trichonephila clavata TaxID=2740835 RepID=A0A8X6HH37_TRICU|nr:hypothetical protein TNCT_635731 [Trichonephila clavata]